jgi:hypothetical protein
MTNPSSPAAENDPKRAWRTVVDAIKAGEGSLGEKLYLLGAGPVPVEGASGGAMTLDARGGVVLVIGLAEPSAAAGDQIARQLGALSGLPGSKLREAGVDPESGGGLAARHAAYFDLSEPVELNSGQRCVVVLQQEPAEEARAALAAALGDSLGGVFLVTEAGVAPFPAAPEDEIVLEPEAPAEEPVAEVEAPAEEAAAEPEAEAEEAPEEEAVEELEVPDETPEEPGPEGPASIEAAIDAETAEAEADEAAPDEAEAPVDEDAGPDLVAPYLEDESTTVIVEETPEGITAGDAVAGRRGISSWPVGNWIGLTMVVVGIVLAVIGAKSLQDDSEPAAPRNENITTVATGVTADATHARWIGQQRVVTLTDGTLVFVYPTQESLNLVKDGATSGATWEDPFALTEVAGAKSLSVDVDSKDRLHVVYSDGTSVNYVRLKNKPAGWKPSRVIQLDDETTSLHVDIAWDEQNQTAHVVWVQQSAEGEAPAWAALTNEAGIHLSEPGLLADPATDVSVMVAVAADGRSSLLITYRRGDQTSGWSSRYSPGRLTDGTWEFNEEELVPINSFVGAVDVVYDRQKTAHLVLRDDDATNLSYFTKTGGEPWSDGEVAVSGDTSKEVEFPTLSYNAGDGNLYLFFQTEAYDPAGEINYMVHTIGSPGWQGAFDITYPADAPEGALYPVAPDRVSVETIVFWTKAGTTYQVDSARVVGPSG